MDERMKKMWYIYVCVHVCVYNAYICTHTHAHTHIYTMEYYSAINKNEIMSSAAKWMDLDIVILSEVSQTEKDKYHMILLMWNLKQ